jgi:hypothetical protein
MNCVIIAIGNQHDPYEESIMIWRLLTGRLTRASLLTFIIILALRASYLINKHDAEYFQRNVLSFMRTPEPTLVTLDWMVIPAPEAVETMTAPLSEQGYEHQIQQLMSEFETAVDEINLSLVTISDAGEMAPEQYNKLTTELADSLNHLDSVSIGIRRLAPPLLHDAFHQRILTMLALYEKVNRALIADYDSPGTITEEEYTELKRQLKQAIDALDDIEESAPYGG